MAKKRLFKTDFLESSGPTDPEELFRTLRGRAPSIKHLWSQQADLLRAYHQQHLNSRDVAIELPTGAGKTLVGLLIAEWRRQSKSERVAYLCPTRQLARQVGEQADDYGVRAHVLVGRQRDYSSESFAEYQSSRAVAITTYSAIFNVNPRIDDAHALILDDAHAGENFMASMWSVELSRSEWTDLYLALIRLLRDAFDPAVFSDLTSELDGDPRRSGLTELVPGNYVRRHLHAIQDLLNELLGEGTSPWYSWNAVKEHLEACNFFVSYDGILIRPLIPPTRVHPAFTQATQRIYMSATLGAGGELERLAGIRNIERLPLPPGWDKRGSGRRLFLVPELSISGAETLEVVGDAAKKLGRVLVLVPSQYDQEGAAITHMLQARGVHLLSATDIEDNLESFVSATNTALVLSRYDGLDLPDETCRGLVLGGLPSGTNLQERFLWSRIAAHALLRDRVLTRFAQGVGRCTRSDNDYSLVLIVGRRLVDFILKKDNRRILNPELQAELEFGLENSGRKSIRDFADLWNAFLEQGEDWKDADNAIVALRERLSRIDDPISRQLKAVVSDEVAYLYARWQDDLEEALARARKVADSLGGDEIKSYRAWWYYLSADTAMALHETTGENTYRKTAQDLLRRAAASNIGIRWFARLGRTLSPGDSILAAQEADSSAVEAIRERLVEWGAVGRRFEQELARIKEELGSTDHKRFHRALKGLGEMLGFDSDLPGTTAAPDCVWSVGSSIYISHEAKSDQKPDGPIGVNDLRQASGHEKWIRAHLPIEKDTRIVCLIETPRTSVAFEALSHAGDVFHVSPEQLSTLFDEIAEVLRRVRSRLTDLSDERLRQSLYREIDGRRLTPEGILDRLTVQRVNAMGSGGEDA